MTQSSSQYLNDVILLEAKEMNTLVKNQYLDDVTEDLIAYNKLNAKQNRIGGRNAQLRNREMQLQTTAAIQKTIESLQSVEEYEVDAIKGHVIKGPMKWIVLVFGPNHQAKDIKSLVEAEYKNLNVIVVLVTNNKLYLRNDPMYATGYSQFPGLKELKALPNKMGLQTKYASNFLGQSFKGYQGGQDMNNQSFYGGSKMPNVAPEIDASVRNLNKLCR